MGRADKLAIKTKKQQQKLRICVLTWPSVMPTMRLFLLNFLDVLTPLCDDLYAITGGNHPKDEQSRATIKNIGITDHIIPDVRPIWWSIVLFIFEIIVIQLKMAEELFKIRKKVDVVYFCGVLWYFPSMLLAKLTGKKTAVLVWGLSYMTRERAFGKSLLALFLKLSEGVMFKFVDQIDVETESAVSFLDLNKYEKKISINGARYVDTNIFFPRSPLNMRQDIIGFVGRLAEEKGVMNLVGAIPLLLEFSNDLAFWIVGYGQLSKRLLQEVRDKNVVEHVTCTGWIPHEKLPACFSNFKLVVVPSYSEGLPGVVQQAMACGTPVLATRVGGIPDLITDGETGFIMEDNSPECIAENVVRVLKHPNLDEIATNARELIEKEYTYEAMVRKCNESLKKLMMS